MTLFHHTVRGSVPGDSWSWSLWTEANQALTDAQAAWEGAIGSFWTGQADAWISETCTATEASTASVDEATGRQISRLTGALDLPGIGVQGPLPPQVALVVSLRTATATRAGRGRFYLAGIDKAGVAQDSKVGSSVITGLVTACNQLFAGLNTNGFTPVIAHRTKPMTTTPLISFDIGDVFDTQRRRSDDLIEARVSGSI